MFNGVHGTEECCISSENQTSHTERETTTKKVKIYETREFKSTCLNFCSVYSATNHEQLCLHCFKGILTL